MLHGSPSPRGARCVGPLSSDVGEAQTSTEGSATKASCARCDKSAKLVLNRRNCGLQLWKLFP